MTPSVPERQRTLGSLLRLPYQALQSRVYSALARRGFDDLRVAHSVVFRHIDPAGSRVTALAERAGMTKQSMAYLVDALGASGYLKSVPDPADGRAKLAVLSARGKRAMTALVELSAQFEADLALRLGEVKLQQLRLLLEEVADSFDPPAGDSGD